VVKHQILVLLSLLPFSCGPRDGESLLDAVSTNEHYLPWPEDKSYQVTTPVGGHSLAKEHFAIEFGTQYNLLLASTDGWVRLAKGSSKTGGCSPSYGAQANYVVLYWADGSGRESLYLHLSKLDPDIKVGAFVKRGAPIGYSGSTGYSCGAHLHYQVQKGARGPNDRTSHWWLTAVKAPFVEGHPEKQLTMKSQNSPTDSVSLACQKPALDLALDEKP
jgi:murein DD-endopeptidase MepM/ murein hydrolase activator NlpD